MQLSGRSTFLANAKLKVRSPARQNKMNKQNYYCHPAREETRGQSHFHLFKAMRLSWRSSARRCGLTAICHDWTTFSIIPGSLELPVMPDLLFPTAVLGLPSKCVLCLPIWKHCFEFPKNTSFALTVALSLLTHWSYPHWATQPLPESAWWCVHCRCSISVCGNSKN